MVKTISAALREEARKRRARVALGAGEDLDRILRVAEGAGDLAHVVVAGEDNLLEMLEAGEVDAAVRGTLGASKVLVHLRKRFQGFLARAAVIEAAGHSFLLSPVGIDEGRTWQERVLIAGEAMKLLSALGIQPKVGVLSGGRHQDRGRDPWVDTTLREAELVVKELGEGARDYSILLEDALREGANLIIPPSGVVGNYIFRSLVLVGGGKGYGAPALGLDRVFVDTSRANTEEGYLRAITTACALANLFGR
jgi:putative methanogen marker protein 4